MFVRWKRRELRDRYDRGPKEHVLYAVLVKSERRGAKVRQRVVRYLAHIKEKYLAIFPHQEYFWQRVDAHLDELSLIDRRGRQELDERVRRVIEAKLAQRVPRPPARDSEEWKEWQAPIDRLLSRGLP